MKSFAISALAAGWLMAALAGCPHQGGESKVSASAEVRASASINPWRWPSTVPAGPDGELITYGKQLVQRTTSYLGPDAKDKSLRLAGNRLNCTSCHLDNGTKVNGIGFVGIAKRFPAYYAPLDRQISLSERINACFERSLNGRPLPAGSRELKALEAYMTWLSQEVPAGQTPVGTGMPELPAPARAANPAAGQKLYAYHCSACHGSQGEGLLQDDAKPAAGYTFPPVWGKNSFGEGSNMARLLIATRYIKANMPLGRPVLTESEAYDVAGYMLSQPRPAWSLAGKDYPNPKTRPVDLPYGPYLDKAPPAQHRMGPFDTLLKSPR